MDPKNLLSTLNKKELWHFGWVAKHPEYEEPPVDIKTFINSPEYMDAATECWEPIKNELEGLFSGFNDPLMTWLHTEAVFDEGIGAGKSYKSSVIITYLIYRILILKDPQKFLGLAKGSGIYFMNMSIRADQAKKIVFGEITGRVINAPWFKRRGYLPYPKVRSELQFPKNIRVVPGNSKETFPLGFNLLGGVMDEAAFYTDTTSHDVAEEMFNALHNRIKNRFGDKGMLVMISSPRYVDDFIEKKMEEAKTNPKIFSVRKTSWDSKPKTLFSGQTFEMEGYIIPIEYKTEAERNWDRFKRDYMAIPSLALEPYFKQWEKVEACVDAIMISTVTKRNTFTEKFYGDAQSSYYMHIDLSLTGDATGIAMCHPKHGKIIIDMMMQIKPEKNKEIDLAEVRNIVYTLQQRGFSIRKCTYDQFQSASSIQELKKMGINSELLSVDRDLEGYETLKEAFYTDRIRMYRFEPFLMELRRLELVKGKKIDHPAGGSKDIADAVAGAVLNCVKDENMFSFGFAGGDKKAKTPEEILKEAETMPAEGQLVPYGFFQGRRG